MLEKIKTLREIIEPKATKLGLSVEEVLKLIDEEHRFKMIMDQLIFIANTKSIRDDNKLIKFFKSKKFFINLCISEFEFTPNNKQIDEFNKLTINLLDRIKPYNERWMTTRYLFDILKRVKALKQNIPDSEKRVYLVMSIVYTRSLEVNWNNLWFNPDILEKFKPYKKYLDNKSL